MIGTRFYVVSVFVRLGKREWRIRFVYSAMLLSVVKSKTVSEAMHKDLVLLSDRKQSLVLKAADKRTWRGG